MTDTDLARRLVAHPKWPNKWPMGAVTDGYVVDRDGGLDIYGEWRFADAKWDVLDMTHPATVGVLLAMADEACGGFVDLDWIPIQGSPLVWTATACDSDGWLLTEVDAATRGEALARLILMLWGDA